MTSNKTIECEVSLIIESWFRLNHSVKKGFLPKEIVSLILTKTFCLHPWMKDCFPYVIKLDHIDKTKLIQLQFILYVEVFEYFSSTQQI